MCLVFIYSMQLRVKMFQKYIFCEVLNYHKCNCCKGNYSALNNFIFGIMSRDITRIKQFRFRTFGSKHKRVSSTYIEYIYPMTQSVVIQGTITEIKLYVKNYFHNSEKVKIESLMRTCL